jgi:hypothetical protein
MTSYTCCNTSNRHAYPCSLASTSNKVQPAYLLLLWCLLQSRVRTPDTQDTPRKIWVHQDRIHLLRELRQTCQVYALYAASTNSSCKQVNSTHGTHLQLLLWRLLSRRARSLQLWVDQHLIHLLRELRQVLARCRVAAVGAVPLREMLQPCTAATHAAREAAV